MSVNIIELIKGQLGTELTSQASSQLGESEAGVSKAISGLLPVLVGGLANNADNPAVLDTINNASSSGILGKLNDFNSNSAILTGILSSIFGDKLNGIINAIATYAGVSNHSASSLMNTVSAATIGGIGKFAADNQLDKNGISNLLKDQKSFASELIPAGLSISSLNPDNWAKGYDFEGRQEASLPVGDTESPQPQVTRSIADEGTFPDHTTSSEGGSIWKWLLPVILLLLVGYFIWKQCQPKETTTTTTVQGDSLMVSEDTITNANADSTDMQIVKTDEDIDLNGTMLKGYIGGMEDRMINFLKSGGYTNAQDDAALKDTWYDFDHVNFKIGSATELEAGSEGQLQNLVAILKAYPEAKIKIGAYTDKTGDAAQNLKLSFDRANFIKNWLTKNGVGSQVTEAEGYGGKFATVEASASNEARAVDRKMSVRFMK